MNVQQKLALGYLRMKLNLLAAINLRKAGETAFTLFCTPLPSKKSIVENNFMNCEAIQFNLDGKMINGYRYNKGGNPRALLLHGFASSSQNFSAYARGLADEGVEVLAFDAPAHGLSEGKTLNAAEYSDMVMHILNIYGPIHYFLAHSFGGLALSLALEIVPAVKGTRIVLIAPATETTTAIDHALAILGVRSPGLRKSIDEVIFRLTGENTSWFSINRSIRNIDAEILWIHDEEDDVTPLKDALEVQKQGLNNVEFKITRGLGHRKIYRDPAVQSAAVSFLSGSR